MDGLTPLISGLVLASVSGLTALAFRHRHAYARLYPVLNLLASAAYLSLTIWQVAVQVAWTGLSPFIADENHPTAELTKSDLLLPYFWICVVFAALLVFFWINLKLPAFVDAAGNKRGDT